MPNRRYEAGRRFEYRVRNDLRARGYFAVRAAGSHGEADVLASCDRQLAANAGWPDCLLVSCRVDGRLDPTDRTALLAAARKANGTPVLAERKDGRHLQYWIMASDAINYLSLTFGGETWVPR